MADIQSLIKKLRAEKNRVEGLANEFVAAGRDMTKGLEQNHPAKKVWSQNASTKYNSIMSAAKRMGGAIDTLKILGEALNTKSVSRKQIGGIIKLYNQRTVMHDLRDIGYELQIQRNAIVSQGELTREQSAAVDSLAKAQRYITDAMRKL